jgi:DNA-binding beta-propeller fold protein YncE
MLAACTVFAWLLLGGRAAAVPESFVNFESGHVRPLAYLPAGALPRSPNRPGSPLPWGLLFALNTPDNRLAIYRVTDPPAGSGRAVPQVVRFETPQIELAQEVPVGLEPVAVAVRVVDPAGWVEGRWGYVEAWVVNHLSDSVSVVKVPAGSPQDARVVDTLLVCDEPRDIVFAGSDGSRAFVSAARRGQNCPVNADLTTPGLGRAVVQVYDATGPFDRNDLRGKRIADVVLFGDTPRALAADPSGGIVYVAVFRSGNQTTTVSRSAVESSGGMPALMGMYAGIVAQPPTGLIAKLGPDNKWMGGGRDLSAFVRFAIPDYDVFAIRADGPAPSEIQGGRVSGVGSVLFDLVAGPGDWMGCWLSLRFLTQPEPCTTLYVANTEARNDVRFEPVLKGAFSDSRITWIERSTGSITPISLNASDRAVSLASPMGMALSSEGFAWRHRISPVSPPFLRALGTLRALRTQGQLLYVAGFGSDNVGVIDVDDPGAPARLIDLEQSSDFKPDRGKGPTAVVLDEARNCLFVMGRFDQSISVVCPANEPSLASVRKTVWLPDPSPSEVWKGRRFLYDARHLSAKGDVACASCHVFGDVDDLAWDLGDPRGEELLNPNPFIDDPTPPCMGEPCRASRVPHCRGTSVECVRDSDCGTGGVCEGSWPRFCNSDARVACASDSDCSPNPTGPARCIAGRRIMPMKGPMTTQSLRGLRDAGPMHWRGDRFTLTNPLDEAAAFEKFNGAFASLLGGSELAGADMTAFREFVLTLRYPPNPIAPLNSAATPAEHSSFDTDLTDFRRLPCATCHARPLGTAGLSSFEAAPQDMKVPHLRNLYQKVGMLSDATDRDVVRGFGFLHDGSIPSVFDFLNIPLFTFPGDTLAQLSESPRRDMEARMLGFPTGLAPVVGQQVTVREQPSSAADQRIGAILLPAADSGDCDLVVKGRIDGRWHGWHYDRATKTLLRDDDKTFTEPQVRSLAKPSQELTYTCAPPGSGKRIGIDRDDDGILDGKEYIFNP